MQRYLIYFIEVFFAVLVIHLPSQAQADTWIPCGTYPATLNLFGAHEFGNTVVLTTDRGLYAYDTLTHKVVKYNLDEISGTVYWNLPMLTIAKETGLNGRLFAYAPHDPGQIYYSDDDGRNWSSTTSPTGASKYSGIAVLDSGVIVVTTKQGKNLGRGVAISYDNGDNWQRLTEPHRDTGAISPNVFSCWGKGRHCFYNTGLNGLYGGNPAKLVTSIDGGKTWVVADTACVDGMVIIGGDDSTILAYNLGSVVRVNYHTGLVYFRYNPVMLHLMTQFTSVTTVGDSIIVSGYRYDGTGAVKDRSIVILGKNLLMVDSLSVSEQVRTVDRVNSEIWVFYQTRIGKLQGQTISTWPYVVDAGSSANMIAASATHDGVIARSISEVTKSVNCGLGEVIGVLSPPEGEIYDVSMRDTGIIFCSAYYALSVETTTGQLLDLHRGIPKGFAGRYSRFRSVSRTHSGRLIGSPNAIRKLDTILPAMYISDDDGATWKGIRTGWHRRLIDEEFPIVGSLLGAKVLTTSTNVVLTGLATSSFDDDERDSGLTGSGLYRSTDDGESWIQPAPGSLMDGAWIRDLAEADHIVYALSSRLRMTQTVNPVDAVQLFKSENDGIDWEEIPSAALGLTANFRLAAYADTLFLFDMGPTGYIRFSTDAGSTFKRYWEPESGSLMWFSINDFGAVATTSEGVFRRGLTTDIVDERKAGDEVLGNTIPWVEISPLPASDQLSVKFSHLDEFLDGLISAKMYSTTGDVVYDFTDRVRQSIGAGAVTIDVDAKLLADGVYIVHMAAGRDSRTRKVMIRK